MDVSFYATTELIDELTKRSTFAGIVIYSEKESRGEITVHQNWNIAYSNGFANQQVANLLEDVVVHFRQLAEMEE
jgi:hypothetical protein